MSHNLLVISSYFPPIPGVGGRRWAKFTKFLCRHEDVNVHVISAENSVKGLSSSYSDELQGLDFKHTILPSNYPKQLEYLEYGKRSILNSINVRLSHFLIKRKLKGNYWDNTSFWEGYFKNEIPEIIAKEGIQTVIISGPPYRYVKYAVEMCEKLEGVQLILDYRDPWNNFNEQVPMAPERKQYEIDLEMDCLQRLDKIIVVSEFQKELLLKKEGDFADIHVLRNGFDTEDLLNGLKEKADSEKITIAHFGTLHIKKDYYWLPFLNAIERLKQENPSLYAKINFEFIGYCPAEIEKYILDHVLNVKLYGVLEPGAAYDQLNQADIALWFKYDLSPGDFATKFGDYIALRKFIWCFSVRGVVTEHIEKEGIGLNFYRDTENLEDVIFQALCAVEEPGKRTFNPAYSAEELSIKSLTDKLLDIIQA